MDEQRTTGILATVVKRKGFGFINVPQPSGETIIYYVNKSAMKEKVLPVEGTRLSFFTAPPREGQRNWCAVNVEVL